MEFEARVAGYGEVSAELASLDGRRLRRLLDAAPVVHSGIGGTAVRLEIAGRPVFAKRVPLTAIERRREGSTANMFALPAHYQFGVGSAGFGVWRELAAHLATTGWVLSRRHEGFPLLYHWRVVDGASSVPVDRAEIASSVEFWHGSVAVRRRLEALAEASAAVVLFCEHFPGTVRQWVTGREVADAWDVMATYADSAEFLRDNGWAHFDGHFGNVLTDGRRLYCTDFGLATSSAFELSAEEAEFLALTAGHDESYAVTRVVNWLAGAAVGMKEHLALAEVLRRGGTGGLPAAASAFLWRHAPIATVVNEFYARLHTESRTAPYPAERLRAAVA
ncbi:protein kinase family protein [Saccharothrix deserti]|uniref:protein kinase family protein n=1 Tax=Saccharothrix deserti TaxID=2593674 RepID=UPI00131E928E|nr:protein kinase family protein [Saccharothrix deserti]